VHGLQPDALYVVIPALALPTKLAAVSFIFMFVIGTCVSMGAYTLLIGERSSSARSDSLSPPYRLRATYRPYRKLRPLPNCCSCLTPSAHLPLPPLAAGTTSKALIKEQPWLQSHLSSIACGIAILCGLLMLAAGQGMQVPFF
jgi:hypothetical protein